MCASVCADETNPRPVAPCTCRQLGNGAFALLYFAQSWNGKVGEIGLSFRCLFYSWGFYLPSPSPRWTQAGRQAVRPGRRNKISSLASLLHKYSEAEAKYMQATNAGRSHWGGERVKEALEKDSAVKMAKERAELDAPPLTNKKEQPRRTKNTAK